MPDHQKPVDAETKDTAFPFIVGTLGWQRIDWRDTYYPSDLPDEWWLPFYANDFTGVLVPAAEWRQADPQLMRQWQRETPEHFAILLEADDETPPDPSLWTAPLGNRFAGLVATTPRPGMLRGAGMDEALRGSGDVVLLTSQELGQRRLLGQQLTALASRPVTVRALIVTDNVDPGAVQELRILAEMTGLA